MSYWRRARKVDTTQSTIVEALRKAGCVVEVVGRPVDLLVRHVSWPPNTWRLIECKTARGKRNPKARLRTDQILQNAFIETHGIERVTTPEEALRAIGAANWIEYARRST